MTDLEQASRAEKIVTRVFAGIALGVIAAVLIGAICHGCKVPLNWPSNYYHNDRQRLPPVAIK